MELFFLSDERLRALARRARGDERRLARALRRVYAHEAPPGGPDVLVMGPEDGAFEVQKVDRTPFSRRDVVSCAQRQLLMSSEE